MADVKLGPSGSETILPAVKWLEGEKPSFTVSTEKQIEQAVMSDGTIQYAMFRNKRTITLEWGFLSKADLDIMKSLQALNQTLRYQDNNRDATWYNVIITSFDDEPSEVSARSMGYYKLSMTLKEV